MPGAEPRAEHARRRPGGRSGAASAPRLRGSEPHEAVIGEIQRMSRPRLGHLRDLCIYVETGGAAEGDFLVAAAELQAAALGEGLHVGACGEEAASASIPAP